MNQIARNIKVYGREVAFFAFFGLALTILFSFLRPLEYSSTARFLVVQKVQPADAYSAIKAVETITDNLSEVVHTTSFFDRVLATDIRIRKNYFSRTEAKRRKQWNRMVSSRTARGSGFLTVTVYHPDKREAHNITNAISQVLITQGWEYVNADIQIKIVDPAIESRFPARPNIPGNAVAGLVLGAIIGAVVVFQKRSKEE